MAIKVAEILKEIPTTACKIFSNSNVELQIIRSHCEALGHLEGSIVNMYIAVHYVATALQLSYSLVF